MIQCCFLTYQMGKKMETFNNPQWGGVQRNTCCCALWSGVPVAARLLEGRLPLSTQILNPFTFGQQFHFWECMQQIHAHKPTKMHAQEESLLHHLWWQEGKTTQQSVSSGAGQTHTGLFHPWSTFNHGRAYLQARASQNTGRKYSEESRTTIFWMCYPTWLRINWIPTGMHVILIYVEIFRKSNKKCWIFASGKEPCWG